MAAGCICIYVCMYVFMHVCIDLHKTWTVELEDACVYMHACMYVGVCVCGHKFCTNRVVAPCLEDWCEYMTVHLCVRVHVWINSMCGFYVRVLAHTSSSNIWLKIVCLCVRVCRYN